MKLKGRQFHTMEDIQGKSQSAWHWQNRTSRKCSKSWVVGSVYMGDSEADSDPQALWWVLQFFSMSVFFIPPCNADLYNEVWCTQAETFVDIALSGTDEVVYFTKGRILLTWHLLNQVTKYPTFWLTNNTYNYECSDTLGCTNIVLLPLFPHFYNYACLHVARRH